MCRVQAGCFQEFLKCLLLRGRFGFKVTDDAMPQASVVVEVLASLKQRYFPSPFNDYCHNCVTSGEGWRLWARCHNVRRQFSKPHSLPFTLCK